MLSNHLIQTKDVNYSNNKSLAQIMAIKASEREEEKKITNASCKILATFLFLGLKRREKKRNENRRIRTPTILFSILSGFVNACSCIICILIINISREQRCITLHGKKMRKKRTHTLWNMEYWSKHWISKKYGAKQTTEVGKQKKKRKKEREWARKIIPLRW